MHNTVPTLAFFSLSVVTILLICKTNKIVYHVSHVSGADQQAER